MGRREFLKIFNAAERKFGKDPTRLAGEGPREHFRRNGPAVVSRQYEPPPGINWDEERYRGDAYASYGWGCDVAEVELDPVTFEVKATKLTVVIDVGKALHPVMALGQIEGGTAQGVGWALIEHVAMQDGAMANAQLTNYTIPTTLDAPRMDTVLLEHPYANGPFGAKGIGEIPMDGPAPAIVNAIRSLGLDVREVPALPEMLMAAALTRGQGSAA